MEIPGDQQITSSSDISAVVFRAHNRSISVQMATLLSKRTPGLSQLGIRDRGTRPIRILAIKRRRTARLPQTIPEIVDGRRQLTAMSCQKSGAINFSNCVARGLLFGPLMMSASSWCLVLITSGCDPVVRVDPRSLALRRHSSEPGDRVNLTTERSKTTVIFTIIIIIIIAITVIIIDHHVFGKQTRTE